MGSTAKLTDLDAIRKDISKFYREIILEFYLHGSGQKEDLVIGPIYGRYGHLFSRDLALNCLERRNAAVTEEDKKSWKHLYQFAFSGYTGQKVKGIIEAMAKRQNELKVTVRGKEIGYHAIVPWLTNEPDKDIRRELDEALIECESDLNKFRIDKWDVSNGIFMEFGYENYVEGCRDVSGVDYEWLAEELRAFLEETEDQYVKEFDELAGERLGYPIGDAEKCDLAYLMRGESWDEFFPAEGMVEHATEFLGNMGLPIGDVDAIRIDIEEREKKRPRAFCSAVKPGKEVYVCLKPTGGAGDYLTFLHELGHAYHFAHTDSSLPSEITLIGDSATSEIFAFNFNYIVTDPNWLKKYLGMSDPEPFVSHQRKVKLYFLRRYASKFLYELELHSDYDMEKRSDKYSGHLDSGLKAKHRQEQWLADLDDAFYSAGYLRAWIFEYQLREHLIDKHGPEWWDNPDTGNLLREMWSTGRKYMPEELAAKMLGTGLDLAPIKREVTATA